MRAWQCAHRLCGPVCNVPATYQRVRAGTAACAHTVDSNRTRRIQSSAGMRRRACALTYQASQTTWQVSTHRAEQFAARHQLTIPLRTRQTSTEIVSVLSVKAADWRETGGSLIFPYLIDVDSPCFEVQNSTSSWRSERSQFWGARFCLS